MYVYQDQLYVQSPYFSSKQEIRYKLPSNKYESISDISPKSVKEDLVTYGPFTDIVAFAYSPACRLHFPSKSQFRTLEKYP